MYRTVKTLLDEKGFATDLISDEAIRLIENRGSTTPLFLFVSYNAPHTPVQAHQKDIDAYKTIFTDKDRRTYAAMVTCMDRGIGRIVSALETAGLRNNTLIFFCSDNGGPCDSGADNGPLRGHKGTLYDGGARVPAIVNWLGRIPAGQAIAEPFHIVDLFPSIVRQAGGSLKQALPLDGRDFMATVVEGANALHDHVLVNTRYGRRGAIRQGPWKLVMNGKDADYKRRGKPVYELFNLENDPKESVNVVNDHPNILARLSKWLPEYAKQEGKNPGYTAKPKDWNPKTYWGVTK